FATGFTQIVLTCIVMGVGVGGAIPLSFMLLAEFSPAKYRGMVMVAVGIISITGGFLIASAGALFLMDSFGWRSLFLIGLTPALFLPVIYWLVPESPRYLVSRGRSREAAEIVERLEKRAGIAPMGHEAALEGSDDPDSAEPAGEGSLSLKIIGELWKPRYRRRTLMLWSYAFGFGFFTFGFLTWLPTVLRQLGFDDGSIHLNTTIMDLFAIPSAIITALLFFYWSTKRTLTLYPIVAGAAMVVFSALVWNGTLNAAWLLLVGGVVFFFGTILLGVFGPYSAEVYPTTIRGTGSGWATGFSRFGALAAIPIGGLILSGGLPIYVHQLIFGIPLLVVGLIMAGMGIETRRRRLEEIA
ncbi:MAG: MFS transporter, partial [Chloroflexi bacterium]|nr:MFS transporter [Chloroflexota bacterium]